MAVGLRPVSGDLEGVLAAAARAGAYRRCRLPLSPTVEESDGAGGGGTRYHDQPQVSKEHTTYHSSHPPSHAPNHFFVPTFV